MHTNFKNLFHTLIRFKTAAILNILGLTVGFVVFILIMQEVYYELSFDRFHPQADRIYRFELAIPGFPGFQTSLWAGMEQKISGVSPEVNCAASSDTPEIRRFFVASKNVQESSLKEKIVKITPSFLELFNFKLLRGDQHSLENPSMVLFPESLAKRIFGRTTIEGEILQRKEGMMENSLVIAGVYKDFPKNSVIQNCIYRVVSTIENPTLYLKLTDPKPKEVAQQIKADIFSKMPGVECRLNAMEDIYFSQDIHNIDNIPSGDKKVTYIFMAIAVLIMIIAIINFINFTISLVPARIKSINTQKVLGKQVYAIRLSLITEAIIIALFSFLLALGVSYCISLLDVTLYLNDNIVVINNIGLLGLLASVAIALGFVAGIYPAFYLTAFPTALVLKGSFALSSRGKKLRTLLIGFQFIISLILIITACFMKLQYNMLIDRDLGFEKENIVYTKLTDALSLKQGAFINVLRQHPDINRVGLLTPAFFSGTPSKSNINANEDINDYVNINSEVVDMLGLKVIEGRSFTFLEDKAKPYTYCLINRTAQKRLNFKIGDFVQMANAEIIGIVEDFNYYSLHFLPEPYVAYNLGNLDMMDENGRTYAGSLGPFHLYIQIKSSDYSSLFNYINSEARKIDPDAVLNILFLDEAISRAYKNDAHQTSLITFFSIISIILSLVGVFGLVLFDTACRQKEIGIRKVMGATVQEVLLMFNRSYVRIVLVCFVLAAPVAYYATKQWLNSFAYKTPMYFWVFLLALFVVLLITILTVTFQSYRAATENPVDSIKTE